MESLREAGEHLNLAVLQNDLELLKELISEGHNVNSVGALTRRTPLHHACTRGWLDMIDMLLGYNSDVNINTSDNQGTPLHMACESGRLEVVKRLTGVKECDVNYPMVYHNTPLIVAAVHGRYPVVKHLASLKKCDLNASSMSGRTALMAAAEGGHVEVVRALVEAGCNVNQQDGRGRTAVHYSVFARQLSVLKELIRCKANIDLGDRKGNSPLHLAASKGYLDVISCLGSHRANLYALNKNCDTPLNVAVKEAYPTVTEKLLDVGTNPNMLTNSAIMSVFLGDCVSSNKYNAVLKVLIKAGVDLTREIKHTGIEGSFTPLQFTLLIEAYDAAKIMMLTEFDFSTDQVWIENIPVNAPDNPRAVEFFLWHKQEICTAITLKRLCRQVVNKTILFKWPLWNQVNQLPLPTFLKNFLLYRDLDAPN